MNSVKNRSEYDNDTVENQDAEGDTDEEALSGSSADVDAEVDLDV